MGSASARTARTTSSSDKHHRDVVTLVTLPVRRVRAKKRHASPPVSGRQAVTLLSTRSRSARWGAVNARPRAAERVRVPEALLSRSDLRELGLERRAIDAVF